MILIQPPKVASKHHEIHPLFVTCMVKQRNIRRCIQKFPDRPPGATTANGTALRHWVQLYRYFVSQYSEFCRHNPLLFLIECLLLFISLSTQSGNFWLHPYNFTLQVPTKKGRYNTYNLCPGEDSVLR
jgi:hypothetical protein